MNLKDEIVRIVTEYQGMKATELVTYIPLTIHTKKDLLWVTTTENIIAAINELVKERRLVEVEYVLPNMSYRVKSFLLPAGTQLDVNGRDLMATEYVEDIAT